MAQAYEHAGVLILYAGMLYGYVAIGFTTIKLYLGAAERHLPLAPAHTHKLLQGSYSVLSYVMVSAVFLYMAFCSHGKYVVSGLQHRAACGQHHYLRIPLYLEHKQAVVLTLSNIHKRLAHEFIRNYKGEYFIALVVYFHSFRHWHTVSYSHAGKQYRCPFEL